MISNLNKIDLNEKIDLEKLRKEFKETTKEEEKNAKAIRK